MLTDVFTETQCQWCPFFLAKCFLAEYLTAPPSSWDGEGGSVGSHQRLAVTGIIPLGWLLGYLDFHLTYCVHAHRSAALICVVGDRAGIFENLLLFSFLMYRLAELFSSRTDAHFHASPEQSLCVVITCPHEINITCKKEIKASKHLSTWRLCFLHIIPLFWCVPFIR